jgi:phosphatidylinositol glycan class F
MSTTATLPLKEYFSSLSFQSLLLTTAFLFVPRSTLWVSTSVNQQVSTDRPEHPFFTPLTSDPVRTMLCNVFGTVVITVWWGSKLRGWMTPVTKPSKVGEAEVELRQNRKQATIQVC